MKALFQKSGLASLHRAMFIVTLAKVMVRVAFKISKDEWKLKKRANCNH